jgi:hypothetical protein
MHQNIRLNQNEKMVKSRTRNQEMEEVLGMIPTFFLFISSEQ